MVNNRIPPGPSGHWLLGSLKEYKNNILEFFLDSVDEYGDLVKIRLGPRSAYLVRNASLVERVLKTKSKIYSKNTPGLKRVKEALKNGLLTTWGDEWRRQRRISQQAFRKNKIEAFSTDFLNSAEKTRQVWNLKLKEGNTIDITESMMRNTLQSAVTTMFSDSVGNETKEIIGDFGVLNEVANLRIPRVFNLPLWFPTGENIRYSNANKNLHSILGTLIKKRRESGHKFEDLLGLLMNAKDEETGSSFTDEELRYQLLTVLMGGVDTSANTLAFAFHQLAKYPEEVEKIRKEANEAFVEKGVSFEKLDYTKMFVNEVFRLFPPVPIFGRVALEEDEWSGFKIPKGMLLITSPFVVQRNPEYWPDPERFNPERHLPALWKKRPPFSFFPYSGGPRICIGMGYAQIQLPLTIAYLVRYFDFYPVNEEFKLRPSITLGTEKPIHLRLVKRKV
ncbi:cytochrome P450 [Bacteriovoracales bacterium]|nr:cytochrome P450 [Bacteriovoracales bacterium]